MMENNEGNAGSLFGGLGGLGAPRQSNLQGLSPYLNIDTNYLQSSPEYLFDQETKRGGMEKSFTAIGTSVCIGAGLGGTYGIYDGIRQTAKSDFTGKMRRTQILNYCVKGSSSVGNALGSIAVVYSLTHFFLTKTVCEEDTEAKSMVSGAFTGALFKSTAGARKALLGTGTGLGLAAFWAFFLKKQDHVQNFI